MSIRRWKTLGTGTSIWFRVLVSAVAFSAHPQCIQASGVAFQSGDVFAGVGNGTIRHFRNDGTLLDTLDTGAGSTEDTGMGFDATGSLYATVFQANNLYKFDHSGNRIGTFGSGYNQDPESMVFDNTGNLYVGQADGTHQVLKFSSTGALLASYSPQPESRGTDWIDLAADQCTLFYTSEGLRVKRFNVCTNTQLTDFATLPNGELYAVRIRPNGDVLVAATGQAYRLNSAGVIQQTYTIPGSGFLFALNLDPDNKSFWTAGYSNGLIFRVDIATGSVITQFNAGSVSPTLAGLTVAGEITAAVNAPPPTTSYYVETTNPTTLRNAGRDLALSQIAAGVNQDSVVALLFKAPTYKNGQYGVSGLGSSTPLSTVEPLVEDFVSGYYNALGANNTLHVRVAIATSNGRTMCGGSQVTYGHGQAWATMVNNVASWVVSQGYSAQVDIAGGSDMEAGSDVWAPNSPCNSAGQPQWASASETESWVDGYASVFPRRFLYDVGDAGGCPETGTTGAGGLCNAGWGQYDVWYVAWNSPPAEPLPEIYRTDSKQAAQWQQLSLYGYLAHSGSMIMAGALTESGACQQVSCPAVLQNTPQEGWQQLYNALNADPRTKQTLSWSTDIKKLY